MKCFETRAVVCTAFVEEIGWLSSANNREACCECDGSRFGLFLTDIKEIIPAVPCAGHQGIWEWNP